MIKVNVSNISIADFAKKYGLFQLEMIKTCYMKKDPVYEVPSIVVQNVGKETGVLTVCKDLESFVKMVQNNDVIVCNKERK